MITVTNEIVRQEFQKLLAKQVEGIIYVAAHERLIDIIPEDLPIPTVVALWLYWQWENPICSGEGYQRCP